MTGHEPLIVTQDRNRATDREWSAVLAGLPLFEGIGRRDLRRIAGEAEFAEIAPGDTAVWTAGPSDHFYVILSGEARAFGKPAARTLRTGDYFGEIGLLDQEPRSASIVATSELHVMRLPRRAFDGALERHPSLARTLLAGLGSRVRALEHQAAG